MWQIKKGGGGGVRTNYSYLIYLPFKDMEDLCSSPFDSGQVL